MAISFVQIIFILISTNRNYLKKPHEEIKIIIEFFYQILKIREEEVH